MRFSFLVFCVAFAFSSIAAAASTTELTVQMDWRHHATYGGFYAAITQGYYTQEGLDVTWIEGGPEIDWVIPVVSGQAQIGIGGAEQLVRHRAEGKPVRAVGAILRKNPVAFFALKEKGIRTPEDFVGKKIRVAPNLVLGLRAMMGKLGISPASYTEVTLPSKPSLVLEDAAQVWGSYIVGLPVEIRLLGYDIDVVLADDYGVHSFARVIYSTDDYIATHPDQVEKFLRASLRGWQWAVENAAKVGGLVKRFNPDIDVAVNSAAMAAMIPLVQTGEDNIGWMKPSVWENIVQTLRDYGTVSGDVEPGDLYTLQFLERIYRMN